MDEGLYERRLARERSKVALLEGMIEDKTREIFLAHEEIKSSYNTLSKLHRAMPSALLVVNASADILDANTAASQLIGGDKTRLIGQQVTDIWPEFAEVTARLSRSGVERVEAEWSTSRGSVPVLVSVSTSGDDAQAKFICVAVDLRERRQLEIELREAQKLESIGQLAAGVAHEINTPMQFVGDNLGFLSEAVSDLLGLVDAYRGFASSVARTKVTAADFATLEKAEEDADLDFVRERAPTAISRALEGAHRVNGIVGAMRSFSHPSSEMAKQDLAEVVNTTLTIATNEYKYVADVVVNTAQLPPITCNRADISQLILNWVTNAAHAIEQRQQTTKGRGTITVATDEKDGCAVLSVSDDGCGMSEEVKNRIFEPFFTTKEVGKGTGQGLSIVHNVAKRHHAKLIVESKPGHGSTFQVHLPLEQVAETAAALTNQRRKETPCEYN